jgi:hypothetical protein
MIPINYQNCKSVKRKGSKLQCPCKKKEYSDYCGKHSNSKNIINYIDILNNNIIMKDNNKDNNKIKNTYDYEYDYENIELFKKNIISKTTGFYKVYFIRQMIKYHNLPINSKQSKSLLVNDIYNYYIKLHNYDIYINKIIKIQSLIRMKLIMNIKQCKNEEEIMTLESLYNISLPYFIKIIDNNGYYYGFDIRSLIEIIKNGCKNPYTLNKINDNELNKINDKIKLLKNNGINLDIEKDVLNPEKMMELRMIDIFHKFDLLDNYTNHNWFKNLHLNQLKQLYRVCEDIWNYRTELTFNDKKKIIHNGIAFNIPIYQINKTKHKINLQKIILDEYEKFATHGLTKDDRKLGVMLMLTGLVEISSDAGNALPHLVQVF